MECSNCHAPVGDGPRRAPVHADGDVFCARCFVFHRAVLEVGRFSPAHYTAVLCSPCGWESVDLGRGCCGQCGSRFVLALPPAVPA